MWPSLSVQLIIKSDNISVDLKLEIIFQPEYLYKFCISGFNAESRGVRYPPEHIPIFRQIPDFTSCRVFETYPGFEIITGIHINVNFQVFTHLRNKTRLFDKVKCKQNRK